MLLAWIGCYIEAHKRADIHIDVYMTFGTYGGLIRLWGLKVMIYIYLCNEYTSFGWIYTIKHCQASLGDHFGAIPVQIACVYG